jgi:hypothetical protein
MKTTNSHDVVNSAPASTFDCGRVRASVWTQTENGETRYKITISKSFKQGDGWTRGRTFFSGELAAVVEVVARAQRWIQWQQREAQAQLALAGT